MSLFCGGLTSPERKRAVFTGSLKHLLYELWNFPLSARVPGKSSFVDGQSGRASREESKASKLTQSGISWWWMSGMQ